MKVSVVIPTFNRSQYIGQAIKSVLEQTRDDIEIIVVDDGSTDDTREKIRPYLTRINYLYTERGGPSKARNIGMKRASGEYISFLDSDDLYYPYKTAIQSDFLDKFPDIAMVYTEFSGFDDSGFWDEFHLKKYHRAYQDSSLSYEKIFSENITIKDAGLNYPNWNHKKIYLGNIFRSVYQNLIVNTTSVMFRKKILDIVGYQNEEYLLFEDLDFILRICKTSRVAFMDIPTYKHRYHSNQISSSQKKSGLETVISKQLNLLEIYEKYGLKDKCFYVQNKELVERRLATLHKALVIPLLAKGKRIKDVRFHLSRCREYGFPENKLWLLTFFPYVFQRMILKAMDIHNHFKQKVGWLY